MTGYGLKISNTGQLSVDHSASFTWTGSHSFTRPISFSPEQKIAFSSLFHSQSALGDLMFYSEGSYDRLPIGQPGMSLISSGVRPRWGYVDLEAHTEGVLPIHRGGTGMSSMLMAGLVFSNSHQLQSLPFGADDTVLVMRNGAPEWQTAPGVAGSGETGCIPVWSAENTLSPSPLRLNASQLSLSGSTPSLILRDTMEGSLKLTHDGLQIGVHAQPNDSKPGAFLRVAPSETHIFGLVYVSAENDQEKLLVSWDQEGQLCTGTVPVKNLTGKLLPEQGGTGWDRYVTGDILFAESSARLARLSTKNKEGCFLSVVNGVPAWVTLSASGAVASTASRLAIEGNALYFHDSDRSLALVTQGSDVTGRAAGLSRILDVEMGGTGADLSRLPAGSLLFSQGNSAFDGLAPGKKGDILTCGANGNLIWKAGVLNVLPGDGVLVTRKAETVHLSINTENDFNPIWKGAHVFSAQTGFTQTPVLARGLFFEEDHAPRTPETGELWREEDRLMYRSNGSTICLSEPVTASESQKTAHYISLAYSEFLGTGEAQAVGTLMPHSLAKPLSGSMWLIKRIDLLCDAVVSEEDAWIDVIDEQGRSVLVTPIPIPVSERRGFSLDFQRDLVHAGEILTLVIRRSETQKRWSAWMLLEEAN